MTLTLTPEIEQAIDDAAQRQGTTPEQIALETLTSSLLPLTLNDKYNERSIDAEAEGKRLEALARIRSGYYARLLGPTSLMQNKEKEKAREERRWR